MKRFAFHSSSINLREKMTSTNWLNSLNPGLNKNSPRGFEVFSLKQFTFSSVYFKGEHIS